MAASAVEISGCNCSSAHEGACPRIDIQKGLECKCNSLLGDNPDPGVNPHPGVNCLLFKSTTLNIRKHTAGISDIACHRYFLICNLLLKNEADIYFLQETTDEFYLVMLHQSSLPSLYHIYYSTTINCPNKHTEKNHMILMSKKRFMYYYNPFLTNSETISCVIAVTHDNKEVDLVNVHGIPSINKQEYIKFFFDLMYISLTFYVDGSIIGGDFNTEQVNPSLNIAEYMSSGFNDVYVKERDNFLEKMREFVSKHSTDTTHIWEKVRTDFGVDLKKSKDLWEGMMKKHSSPGFITALPPYYDVQTSMGTYYNEKKYTLNSDSTVVPKQDKKFAEYFDKTEKILNTIKDYLAKKNPQYTDADLNAEIEKQIGPLREEFVKSLNDDKEQIQRFWNYQQKEDDKKKRIDNVEANVIFDRIFFTSNLLKRIHKVECITSINNSDYTLAVNEKINQRTGGLLRLQKVDSDLRQPPNTKVWVSDHYASSTIISTNIFPVVMNSFYFPQCAPLMFLKTRSSLDLNFVSIMCRNPSWRAFPYYGQSNVITDELLVQKYKLLIECKESLEEIARKHNGDYLYFLKDYLCLLFYNRIYKFYENCRVHLPSVERIKELIQSMAKDIYDILCDFLGKNIQHINLYKNDLFYKELVYYLKKDIRETTYTLPKRLSLKILAELVEDRYPHDTVAQTAAANVAVAATTAIAQTADVATQELDLSILYECKCDKKHTKFKNFPDGTVWCLSDKGTPIKKAGKKKTSVIKKDSAPATASAPASALALVREQRVCPDCKGTEWIHDRQARGECKKCRGLSGGSRRLTNKRLYKNLLKLIQ
jgi:hypothetical protein